ncbi:hypothetical protein GMMP15_1600011 [Candidatus Magnetomoraceae bacterium gMMP-15]
MLPNGRNIDTGGLRNGTNRAWQVLKAAVLTALRNSGINSWAMLKKNPTALRFLRSEISFESAGFSER